MATAESLPFFPLGMVALPLQPLRLHIFEPRYRQLFGELEGSGGEFVQVPIIESRVQRFATAARLLEVSKRYASGELDVACMGTRVVSLRTFEEQLPERLYGGGEVTPVRTTLEASDLALTELLLDRCRQLLMLLGAHRRLPEPTDPGVSYALGHWLGLKIHEEYALLTMSTEDGRQEHLLDLVGKRIEAARDTSELRRRAQMNGHFRYPPAE